MKPKLWTPYEDTDGFTHHKCPCCGKPAIYHYITSHEYDEDMDGEWQYAGEYITDIYENLTDFCPYCGEKLAASAKQIYTHDEAMAIVELFENLLVKHNIKLPSPEDDEREEDNIAALYGSVYGDLMDSIENILIDILERSESGYIFIPDEFSGNY